MQSVIDGGEAATWESELFYEPPVFVAGFLERVELVVIIRFIDVKLIGTNANDWS